MGVNAFVTPDTIIHSGPPTPKILRYWKKNKKQIYSAGGSWTDPSGSRPLLSSSALCSARCLRSRASGSRMGSARWQAADARIANGVNNQWKAIQRSNECPKSFSGKPLKLRELEDDNYSANYVWSKFNLKGAEILREPGFRTELMESCVSVKWISLWSNRNKETKEFKPGIIFKRTCEASLLRKYNDRCYVWLPYPL